MLCVYVIFSGTPIPRPPSKCCLVLCCVYCPSCTQPTYCQLHGVFLEQQASTRAAQQKRREQARARKVQNAQLAAQQAGLPPPDPLPPLPPLPPLAPFGFEDLLAQPSPQPKLWVTFVAWFKQQQQLQEWGQGQDEGWEMYTTNAWTRLRKRSLLSI